MKCRECIHFEEEVHKDENGKEVYKLYCSKTGKEIPSYNTKPDYCLAFKWSPEAWREYAE